ncbi:MAG: hypothetical protein HKL95_00745 [Phycisphaerae bacterium]|nr:hypothetical protein [Phycisphaerae bacterium]
MVWQDSANQKPRLRPLPDAALPLSPSPQFAILQHRQNHYTHWDLLLELPARELLATFRVDQPPHTWATVEVVPVQALPDHRRIYLDYQGPISGNRGTVIRCDRGTLRLLHYTTTHMAVEIAGALLRGRLNLRADDSAPNLWSLHWSPEKPPQPPPAP